MREKRINLTKITGHKIHIIREIRATISLGNLGKVYHTIYDSEG